MSKTHNLDVSLYSLKELLKLFNIDNYDISSEQIKYAKKKTLMTHPDKSKLPKEYFLFYKKAFDIVFNFYNEQNKQNQIVQDKPYSPFNNSDENEQIKAEIKKTNPHKFQREFNKLFEQHMIHKPDTEKNNWFKDESALFESQQNVNASNMGQVFRQMKQNNQEMIVRKDVQQLTHTMGTNLYDDDDDTQYCGSNIFDRLKFDDLRKVHKDQTIMDVCESDYGQMQTFASIEQYNRHRNSQNVAPMTETQSLQHLNRNFEDHKQQMMSKQHKSNLQSMEYAKKNKDVMGSLFLHIKK